MSTHGGTESGIGAEVEDAPAWAEPEWRLGHVVRDELGDVYAWTGIKGRPWVLLEHHHAGTEHLVGAPSPDDWLWRPVEVIGEPVKP